MMTSIKNAQNLHKQFGHASPNNLKNLFKKAGLFSTEISKLINENCDNCVVCKTHKKPPPRPIAGLQKAKTLNHTVAMDLHSLGKNIWYFHIIEKFTRVSNTTIIKSKNPPIIIKNVFQNWISFFGSTSKVFSNNVGEFSSEEFSDFCKIEITTTAESPWCNGIFE